MTPRQTHEPESRSEGPRFEDLSVGELLRGFRALRNIGYALLGLLVTGGGFAALKIPGELDAVRAEHQRILREQARSNRVQNYMICVMQERIDPRGNPRRCPQPEQPQQFRYEESDSASENY